MKSKNLGEKMAVAKSADFMTQFYGQLVEKSPANLMFADKDLVIRYMNPASMNTLKKIEHLLPCKADQVIGQSIDMFHKNPHRVRGIIGNDKGMPHSAIFQIGPERMELTAHAIYGEKGEVSGYVAAWAIVTVAYRLERAMDAIYRSRPCVVFAADGHIIRANDLYERMTGLTMEELKGLHHDSFVLETDKKRPENKDLWTKLIAGTAQSGEFRRLGKNNKEIWVACTYYPIPDTTGKVYEIMQFATDVTERKLHDSDYAGQIQAISRAQPVSEYTMDGAILGVNENFEKLLGYANQELIGKHVSIFVDEATRQSADYKAAAKKMWEQLNHGEACFGEARRTTKQGKEIWIEYSYHPIFDVDGKPCKVVNYLRDVTEQKVANNDYQAQIAAIAKSQAVIEFKMDGTIANANDNFLKALGYTLDEIKGKHHSMFVDESYRQSPEYKEFWAKLNRGEYFFEDFKRIGKGGKEVWVQASYNPIVDLNGKPFKVVKYASDITPQKTALNAMIADAVMLSKAAVEGRLNTRADVSRHQGDYRKVVEGVNQTLDAVVTPIQEAGTVLKKIAAGDLTAKVTGNYQGDHADIKNDINAMAESLRSSMASIAVNAQSLASSSEELNATSQQLAGNAEETATQANVVSAASEEVSKNVSVVATGSEEMLASIREISKSANEAARVAKNAVDVAQGTNATISKLGESSAEIGKVIKVITSIAQQTNLLALNATIEAARAGEAGKGFAVVANEVKELAKETARATEEIGQKIEAIQGDTKAAVQAIAEISGIINQVNDISNTIASAVEEQTSTTNEIGRNVTEAAKGTSEIARNISGVAQAAQETTTGANDLQKAGRSLAEMSTQLQALVSQFKLQDDSKHLTHQRAATAGF
jgi:methyl-accepting chemotaxis protein